MWSCLFCASTSCLLKVMTEDIPPLTPSLTASLLSQTIVKEIEGERGERFEVRVLFHMRGDVNRGTCVTLHAFKQTEEQKASCITQVLLVSDTIDGSEQEFNKARSQTNLSDHSDSSTVYICLVKIDFRCILKYVVNSTAVRCLGCSESHKQKKI